MARKIVGFVCFRELRSQKQTNPTSIVPGMEPFTTNKSDS